MNEGMRRRKVTESWLRFCILPGNLLWESRLLKDLSQIIELLSRYYSYNIYPQSRVACCFWLLQRLFVCSNMNYDIWWSGKTFHCGWILGVWLYSKYFFSAVPCHDILKKQIWASLPPNIHKKPCNFGYFLTLSWCRPAMLTSGRS